MRSIVKFGTKLSIAALTVLLGISAAGANTLSEVQINADDNGYNIVLKTDEAAQIKKTVSSGDKMTLELKDVEASPELNTVYNNVANIDNVTILPSSKSDIKIVFKGQDISNSKIYFEEAKTTFSLPAAAQKNESIQLNGPVSSYTPVYNPQALAQQEEMDEDQTANPELNEVLTKMHITKGMLVTAKTYAKKAIRKVQTGDINLITLLGFIFIIAAFMLKPQKKKPAQNPQRHQTLTGILSNKSPQMQREIALNRSMADNMSLNRNSSLNTNPLKAGYGMKAYQQSQKNPYTTAASSNGISGIARRKPLSTSSAPIKKQPVSKVPVATKMTTPLKAQMPKQQLAQNTLNRTIQQKSMEPSDLDSMKFLESITKIYEKNGRSDLAKGLKDNLRKAKMSYPEAV